LINYLQPLALLAARFYVAWFFFAAGMTKVRDWDTTLFFV
jgi:putative oxidoreductase